ncbi:UDP-N-acetylmuramoyl-tripeptide--D-alanyl-D-alanine ligase [Kushneria aurantia]|uniref:UDP-N-acetylmuramoyl-tripeptide--D-alanyl-D-alanine ligase n=1 Tax=Kushneria aurantia TaxID=504092 RepID=A0ABV6FZX2_9GAMM|nr:UDP-N-acetylmuramoyl-tripeptide--D-alanyl-D-alanine ligase [Kushneria aurantia]
MADSVAQILDALALDDSALYDPEGRLAAADALRIETDTRRLAPNDLFVALRGERFDGHDYLQTAAERGAAGALVERRVASSLAQIVVADTRLALGLLARAHRLHWGGRLAAITGNSGKTTVRALCQSILSRHAPTLATRGNLNNDIGVPLTLLQLGDEHQLAVVELGANHSGEIAWTSALARPDVALINNVTDAHVGEFGGSAMIARAKAEILTGLAPDGVAVLNRHDRFYPDWCALARPHEVIDFALEAPARVQALDLHLSEGRYAFRLVLEGRDAGPITLPLLGRHNVLNALAAAGVAHALGCDSATIRSGLEQVTAVARRMLPLAGLRGSLLIDDSYNANPGAMRAALESLAEHRAPRWCLLGAMGELGDYAEAAHREVGEYAAALDIDAVVSVGNGAAALSYAAGERGHHFDDRDAALDFVRARLPAGATVLIKGSLSAGMDRLVEALRADTIG